MESACYVLYSVLAYNLKNIQSYVVCYIFCSFMRLFKVSEIEGLLIMVHVSINVLILICAFDINEHVTV
jgi:hypothetical protein